MKSWKERIKELREDNDLYQKDVAEKLKIKTNMYSRYERGDTELPIRHLITLADFYQVSTDYILGRTKHPEPPKE